MSANAYLGKEGSMDNAFLVPVVSSLEIKLAIVIQKVIIA
jgi:hypothetical protein